MAEIRIANQNTLLEVKTLLGVANPTFAGTNTAMNYLKKIDNATIGSPIVGADGHRYQPVFEASGGDYIIIGYKRMP